MIVFSSCWVTGDHVATIRVEVVAPGMDTNILDYLVLSGFGVAVLLVLSIACYVVRTRKRKTLKWGSTPPRASSH